MKFFLSLLILTLLTGLVSSANFGASTFLGDVNAVSDVNVGFDVNATRFCFKNGSGCFIAVPVSGGGFYNAGANLILDQTDSNKFHVNDANLSLFFYKQSDANNVFLLKTTFIPSTAAWDSNFALRGAFDSNAVLDTRYKLFGAFIPSSAAWDSNFALRGAFDSNAVLDTRYILVSDSNNSGRLDYLVINDFNGHVQQLLSGEGISEADANGLYVKLNPTADQIITSTNLLNVDGNVSVDSFFSVGTTPASNVIIFASKAIGTPVVGGSYGSLVRPTTTLLENNNNTFVGINADPRYNQNDFNSTGAIRGFYSTPRLTGTSGNVTGYIAGYDALPFVTGGGNATSSYGFLTGNPTVSGGSSITNAYGLRIAAITAGSSNNWGVFVDSTNNAFGGNSKFGATTAPTAPVDVTGNIIGTGNVTLSGSSSLFNASLNGDFNGDQGSFRSIGAGTPATGEPITVLTDSGSAGGDAIHIEEFSGGEDWQISVDSSGNLVFYDSGVTTPSIVFEDGSQSVGIGGVDTPDALLDLRVESPTQENILRFSESSSDAFYYEATFNSGATPDKLKLIGDADNIFVLMDDGNIGIREANPKNRFVVIGDVNILTSATAASSLYVDTSGNITNNVLNSLHNMSQNGDFNGDVATVRQVLSVGSLTNTFNGPINISNSFPIMRWTDTDSSGRFADFFINSDVWQARWFDGTVFAGNRLYFDMNNIRFGIGADATPDYLVEITGSSGSGMFGITNSVNGDVLAVTTASATFGVDINATENIAIRGVNYNWNSSGTTDSNVVFTLDASENVSLQKPWRSQSCVMTDVSGSRALDTSYVNGGTRKQVYITATLSDGLDSGSPSIVAWDVTADMNLMRFNPSNVGSMTASVYMDVNPGSTYRARTGNNSGNNTVTLVEWIECNE